MTPPITTVRHDSKIRRWFFGGALCLAALAGRAADANRLTYLDESDPFYVQRDFPKLVTPQWVGEKGVEAVVIMAVDDMRAPEKYEALLRPLLDRLKQIDGRAPVSIFCNALNPAEPQYQKWLTEGLSFEVHTLTHPCPILAGNDLHSAETNYFGCVDLINQIPGSRSVAFRTPCCDSMNSPSPRLFAEIFNQTSPSGSFLSIDSSVMNILSPKDPALPRETLYDAEGKERFRKYLPFPSFKTTVENYPYPYVIGKLCWEFPAVVPSDWETFHVQGATNPVTVADWKAALDATVVKQGTYTMIFHPHGWIRGDQLASLADYAATRHGSKVKFLNLREAQERMDRNLLGGQALRAANGQDNGVRLLDLNDDGFLDVVIGNEKMRQTRIWDPKKNVWIECGFPTPLAVVDPQGNRHDAGARFGVVSADGFPIMLVRSETTTGAWRFDGAAWVEDASLLNGLELDGHPILTSQGYRDRGVRLRDVNNDGVCELVVGNESQNAVFAWSAAEKKWNRLAYGLPAGTSIVDAQGRDNGLRFVDVNGDGFADVLFSNPERFSLHIFRPRLFLGFAAGWSREVASGKPGDANAIPMIVRDGPHRNNGAWFHSDSMWVQNEDTAKMPDLVDRRSFKELLAWGLTPPKSPQDSLNSIHVRPGFKVELVASEPLIESPVAFEWGADGKLWVVEMRDYPLGEDGKGKPGGIVRCLESTKGDGHYDKSTIFLDHLNFPNGLLPWGKGLLISAPPDILYAEDTDGDGKADVVKKLFSGFNEGNQQHRANGFDYGLDNWLYGANGDSGGTVTSARTGKSVSISHRDFRFRPGTGEFETQAGQTQYGRHRDDWGNWFGNENAVGAWHYFIPEQYLARNPYLAVRSMKQTMPDYPDYTRVFPASRLSQRFNDPDTANHLTSANSTMPYRDDLFGPDFEGSYFVSEPVHNLVHREIMVEDGVSFTSHRAPDERDSEFFASTDNWTRPTMTKTGPDGALYIADMYRLVIEHPEWIPMDFQKSVDVRSGENLGRIYRVYPTNATLRPIPRLDRLDTAGLVAALDSPNGWQRDTAQRLLVASADRAALPLLNDLITHASSPKTRVQALCSLDGLNGLTQKILLAAFQDPDSHVREQAIRVSEPLLRASTTNALRRLQLDTEFKASDRLGPTLLPLAADPSLRVRYQLAFTLGEWPDSAAAASLVRLALENTESEAVQIAIMSSAPQHTAKMISALLQNPQGGIAREKLLAQLIGLATALNDGPALAISLEAVAHPQGAGYAAWQFAALGGMLDALARRNLTLAQFQESGGAGLQKPARLLDELFAAARKTASDSAASEADRLAAIPLLGRDEAALSEDVAQLGALLDSRNTPPLQLAALASLGRTRSPKTAQILAGAWKTGSPAARARVLDLLLTRQDWVQVLLGAVEAGQIPAGALGTPRQQKLLNHPLSSIRDRAKSLFAAASADRQAVVRRYAGVAALQGDPIRGRENFRKACVVCHRFQKEGNELGPDLESVAFKPVDYLLTAILDPNQSFEERYISYTAVTKSGQEYSGLVANESANSITLRLPGGAENVILRGDLKELTSSGRSLMPEGFENAFDPQALADLIAWIRTGPAPKVFPGNKPAVIRPNADGSVRLTADRCKIFGDTLVFEDQHQNLGYWRSATDQAVWLIDLPSGGNYRVWLDWALPIALRNFWHLEIGGKDLVQLSKTTGSWNRYRQDITAELSLQAGPQTIVVHSDGPIKDDLFDLREIRLVHFNSPQPPDFTIFEY